jgi:hypothetical protein
VLKQLEYEHMERRVVDLFEDLPLSFPIVGHHQQQRFCSTNTSDPHRVVDLKAIIYSLNNFIGLDPEELVLGCLVES